MHSVVIFFFKEFSDWWERGKSLVDRSDDMQLRGVTLRISPPPHRPRALYLVPTGSLLSIILKANYHYYGGPYLIGPTVHTKTHIFRYLYKQYLVLLTMVPRNSQDSVVLIVFFS